MSYTSPTRGDTLKHALAFALRNVRLERHRLGLSEESRYKIADETVRYLTQYNEWPELKEPAGPMQLADGSNDKRTFPK